MTPTHSASLHGSIAQVIDVECRLAKGLPSLIIVGYASRSISEAKERLRGAFAASNLQLPTRRIVINLAPGDLQKDGTALDIAMAAAILKAVHPQATLEPASLLLGELGLGGEVKPVRGLIACLLAAVQRGYTTAYVPASQYRLAALIPGLTLLPVQTLAELAHDMLGTIRLPRYLGGRITLQPPPKPLIDLGHIRGQSSGKRALAIAAAGGHHLLLSGPPGTGKSLLAKALPGLMPPLANQEILEVNHLHGLISHSDELIRTPPFRAPHHSTTLTALIGSSSPGEVSLSHRGVLLLDELPEFPRSVVEALRQPLEDRRVSLARSSGSVTFPAACTVVATANPCPCGYAGSDQPCHCPAYRVHAYQQKLSGPVLDRIDLYVAVTAVATSDLLAPPDTESSEQVRERVTAARRLQQARLPNHLNADLSSQELKQVINLTSAAKYFLDTAAPKLHLSARAYIRTLKVARTIADLANSNTVEAGHIAEALQFRQRQNP